DGDLHAAPALTASTLGPSDAPTSGSGWRLFPRQRRPAGASLTATVSQAVESDFTVARRAITRQVGPTTIARLHREHPFLDWLVTLGLPGLFGALVFALSRLPFGVPWIACFVAQGFLLQL